MSKLTIGFLLLFLSITFGIGLVAQIGMFIGLDLLTVCEVGIFIGVMLLCILSIVNQDQDSKE